MLWYSLFSGDFFIIQIFDAPIDRIGDWLHWNFFCQLVKPFTQSSIHKVVPFHHPSRRGSSPYKVMLAFSLLLARNEKFGYWGECILFCLNVEWTLSFSVLCSLCGCKLTVMLKSSETRKLMAWKSKLSHVGWIMKRFSLEYWSCTDQGGYMLPE